MRRAGWSCFVLAAGLGLAMAQAPAEFEVATIKKPGPQPDGRTSSRMSVDNGKLNYSNVTLKDVASQAYKVQRYQIAGPDWIDTERYDISAKFAPGSREQLPLMLQALLAQRFNVAVHREIKELPAYSLAAAKGGTKFESAEAQSLTINSSRTHWHMEAKVSMRRFAELLADEVGRPVIDRTGLSGLFALTLDWAPDDAPATNDPNAAPSIFTALQEQLGLKLDSSREQVETIVIDRAERAPTEN